MASEINKIRQATSVGATTPAQFRELQPEDFWSGYLVLANSKHIQFSETIQRIAKEMDFTFSGWITRQDDTFTYQFSRYPRRKFGPVLPIERHQALLKRLADELGIECKQEEKLIKPKFRVLLGLKEGYDEHAKLYTKEEVVNELGVRFEIKEAEIFAVGPWGIYSEPAVVIVGEKQQSKKVYLLAEKFKQSRFAFEDLQLGKSHMVETRHCNDSDSTQATFLKI